MGPRLLLRNLYESNILFPCLILRFITTGRFVLPLKSPKSLGEANQTKFILCLYNMLFVSMGNWARFSCEVLDRKYVSIGA